jgi:hypothetical protein
VGRVPGATPRSTFSVGRGLAFRDRSTEKVQAAGSGTRHSPSMRRELRRSVVRRERWLRGSFGRRRHRFSHFWSFGRGWGHRRGNRHGALVRVPMMHMAIPLRMWLPGRPYGLGSGRSCSDLDRWGFNPRQPNVSGHRRRSGRRQQARDDPQRQQDASRHKDQPPSSRPTNPETHTKLSPQIAKLSPQRSGRGGRVALPAACTFSVPQPREAISAPPKKLSGEGHPTSSYATLSRNSAISLNCSSTQSPGFRE